MSNEGWISISQYMPPLDQEIEVETEDGKVHCAILRGKWGNSPDWGAIEYYFKGVTNVVENRVMRWRPLKSKFSQEI